MTRYSLTLTRERLFEVLDLDLESGVFTWKVKPYKSRPKIGDRAGGLSTQGYRMIGIDGQIYHAHRLVWFWIHGEWPRLDIDHKDRDRDNNRPLNLRLATEAENQWNTEIPKHNTSGHKGVFWLRGSWMALIQKNWKREYLGTFKRFEDACEAYDNAAKVHHGEFSRVSSQ